MALEVRFNVEPSQIGLLLPGVGAAGVAFTITAIVPAGPGQPFTIATTEYVPVAEATGETIDGFCKVDVNPFGPVQLYVALATVLAVRFRVVPSQTGPLLPAVGAAGKRFIVTEVVPATFVHPLTVAVTEYVPAADGVVTAMKGFCEVDVKPFGPVQL